MTRGELTLRFKDQLKCVEQVGFGFLERLSLRNGGWNCFNMAGVAALLCWFENAGQIHAGEISLGGPRGKRLEDLASGSNFDPIAYRQVDRICKGPPESRLQVAWIKKSIEKAAAGKDAR